MLPIQPDNSAKDYKISNKSCSIATAFNTMTLRDYFAGQALLITPQIAKDVWQNEVTWGSKDYASVAYEIADELLKLRKN